MQKRSTQCLISIEPKNSDLERLISEKIKSFKKVQKTNVLTFPRAITFGVQKSPQLRMEKSFPQPVIWIEPIASDMRMKFTRKIKKLKKTIIKLKIIFHRER